MCVVCFSTLSIRFYIMDTGDHRRGWEAIVDVGWLAGREEGKALCIVVGGHLRVRGSKKEA